MPWKHKGCGYQVPLPQDPHGELKGQNVLIVRGSLKDTAHHFSLSVEETRELLAKCRGVLFAQRQKRPKPHRDDKILTAWNGKHSNVCPPQWDVLMCAHHDGMF